MLPVKPHRAARGVGGVRARGVMVLRARGEGPLVAAIRRRAATWTDGEVALARRSRRPLLLITRRLTVTRSRPLAVGRSWRLTASGGRLASCGAAFGRACGRGALAVLADAAPVPTRAPVDPARGIPGRQIAPHRMAGRPGRAAAGRRPAGTGRSGPLPCPGLRLNGGRPEPPCLVSLGGFIAHL